MNRAPPVLLLHGWGGSSKATFLNNGWSQALAAVHRRVLSPDLPGHGAATASIEPDDYADLAARVKSTLPDGELDIIGYSLGAKIALRLGADHPERIGRIVAIGVGNNVFAAEASAEALAVALETGQIDHCSDGVRALVEYSRASGSHPKSLAAVLRRPPNPVIHRDELEHIGARTMLINGSKDHLAQPDDALRSALPGSAYLLLTGASHFQLISDECGRRHALQFLNRLGESPTAVSRVVHDFEIFNDPST